LSITPRPEAFDPESQQYTCHGPAEIRKEVDREISAP
jgi:hypothetical protein